MGFSQGGSAALYSSMARFQKMYGNADLQFVGHISAYAGCYTRFRDEEDVTKPILMLHGTADDLTPIAPCREWAEIGRGRGCPLTMPQASAQPLAMFVRGRSRP
jgi:predicted esterase